MQRSYDDMQRVIVDFQAEAPGAVFETGEVRINLKRALVEWAARDRQGKVVLSGTDAMAFAEDGRIRELIVFVTGFDPRRWEQQ